MRISMQEYHRLFPSTIDGVIVMRANHLKQGVEIPQKGSVVIAAIGYKKQTDVFNHLPGDAKYYHISAYCDGTKYYMKLLRMTRWYSDKPRWLINQRLSRLIHQAARCVAPVTDESSNKQ